MKKVICLVGTSFVIGAVAASVIYLLNSRKKKKCELGRDYDVPSKDKSLVYKDDLTAVTIAEDKPIYEGVKSSAVGSMYSRHEGAATIMSDSFETIRENVKISEDTNDEIDAVSVELEKMLSED